MSRSSYNCFNKGDFAFAKFAFTSGNCLLEFFKDIKSLPLALPYEILPASLSMS